jgi:hypothetical protein
MALESSDASLVPIKRPSWSDRGAGSPVSFLAGFAGCFIKRLLFGIDALIAGSRLL